MKRLTTLLVVAALAASTAPAFAGDLTVTITGVKEGGQVMGALQTESQFLQPAMTYGTMAPSTKGTVTLVFKDVAPGTYSLSVLQDADGDQKMTLDAKGLPAEGWAMKNSGKLRAKPSWATVSFTMTDQPMAFTEAMIYPRKK